FAPMAIDGMRPCTELNPWPPETKYAVVFDEQPMPESFTMFCGSMARPQQASIIAAVVLSCPQPAPSVDKPPPESPRVRPSEFFGNDGCLTFGFGRNVMPHLPRSWRPWPVRLRACGFSVRPRRARP